jgi:hypothetical protein
MKATISGTHGTLRQKEKKIGSRIEKGKKKQFKVDFLMVPKGFCHHQDLFFKRKENDLCKYPVTACWIFLAKRGSTTQCISFSGVIQYIF